jgi:hypothetical protein
MSVDRYDYVMLAVDIKDKHDEVYTAFEEDYKNSKFMPYIEGRNNFKFRIITDCMSDKFCFLGIVLKKTDGYYGFYDYKPIDTRRFDALKRNIKREYFKLFNEDIYMDDVKLYCFTQWL